MEEPVAQPLRLGQSVLAVQEQHAGSGEQVDAGQGELKPRAVRANALDGNRPKPQWAQILTDQATIVACDSFPVHTVALRRV